MTSTTGPLPRMTHLEAILQMFSYRFMDEKELHRALMGVMSGAALDFRHEVDAGRGDRFDFLLDLDIVLEVKIKGTAGDAARQAERYLKRQDVAGIVVAHTCSWGQYREAEVDGKPLHFIRLQRQMF